MYLDGEDFMVDDDQVSASSRIPTLEAHDLESKMFREELKSLTKEGINFSHFMESNVMRATTNNQNSSSNSDDTKSSDTDSSNSSTPSRPKRKSLSSAFSLGGSSHIDKDKDKDTTSTKEEKKGK